MKNGQIWQDVDGNDIQAHGGCIINHEGVYYWYGEHKGADNKIATFVSGQTVSRVDVIGISCYSSTDLVNWKYEGLVLESNKALRPRMPTVICPSRASISRRRTSTAACRSSALL